MAPKTRRTPKKGRDGAQKGGSGGCSTNSMLLIALIAMLAGAPVVLLVHAPSHHHTAHESGLPGAMPGAPSTSRLLGATPQNELAAADIQKLTDRFSGLHQRQRLVDQAIWSLTQVREQAGLQSASNRPRLEAAPVYNNPAFNSGPSSSSSSS
mmetsp:Transcript_4602/g.9933  ORF Transcript_4602/g.9933 Transcript_4602/m.9933 type:complete len:153 (+) Transcript_4602:130-588(+)